MIDMDNTDPFFSMIELPFGFPGKVFRSPMPFGSYDFQGRLYQNFQAEKISAVVLLCSENECERRTGRDLKAIYDQDGFDIVHLPAPDFGTPELADFKRAINETLHMARKGKDLVVHCYAGIGRTGMFMAGLAIMGLGMSSKEAIDWVRRYIPGAIESNEQIRLLEKLAEGS
jgi:protein-tyrosine phosphatase